MDDLKRSIAEHPFLKDLMPDYLDTLAKCASKVHLNAGDFVFREGGLSEKFYLIHSGKVALEIYAPHRGPMMLETLDDGGVLGWAWLFPPYRWHFDARVLRSTDAIVMDGKALQKEKQGDFEFGYRLMKLFALVMQERLQKTRLQLVDMYENPKNVSE